MRATQVTLPLSFLSNFVIARLVRATHLSFAKENGSPAFAGDDDFIDE
jgi:hypothetical protein